MIELSQTFFIQPHDTFIYQLCCTLLTELAGSGRQTDYVLLFICLKYTWFKATAEPLKNIRHIIFMNVEINGFGMVTKVLYNPCLGDAGHAGGDHDMGVPPTLSMDQ